MADITLTIDSEVTAAGLISGRSWLPALVGRTGGGATKLDGLNPALYATGAFVMFDDLELGELHYVKRSGVGVEDDPLIIVPDSGTGFWEKRLSGGSSITGADTRVLFFDGANTPAGDAGLTYNKTTDTLTVLNLDTSAIGGDVTFDGDIMGSSGTFTNLLLGTPSATDGTLVLRRAANAFTTTIKSGVTGANYTLTLPTTDGAANEFLQTNGSGVLAWAAAAGGSGLTIGATAITGGGAGSLLYETAGNVVGEVAAGLTTEILVGGGAATIPVWTTATGTGAPVRQTGATLQAATIGTSFNLLGYAVTTAGALSFGGALSTSGTFTSGGTFLTGGVVTIDAGFNTVGAFTTNGPTEITGGGTIVLGGFTLTVLATGTAVTTATLNNSTLPGAFTNLSATGGVQLGADAGTPVTPQAIRAANASGGTGSTLQLKAGTGTVAGGSIVLQTADTGTLTDRLIILPNGNVGIGTTPISLLHVKGINPKITMSQSSAGEPMTFQFTRADSTTIEAYVDMDGEASNVMRIANQQGDIQFIANAAAAARILSNGSFGIGTTTPASKLAVNGGVHVGGDSDAGDNNLLVDGTITAAGMKTDADSTAGNTRFFLYDVDNATLERVTVGAADTGGAGFKVLRIPN